MPHRDLTKPTEAAKVAPKPWPHPASLDNEALLSQCEQRLARTAGPGGQHRNRVDSKVILTHTPTGMESQAGERRSVNDNRRMALRRLRMDLAMTIRMPVPLGDIGSELWKSRHRVTHDDAGRAQGQIKCSPTHHDYPSLLAEALDVIASANWDVKRAAVRLDVTTTQLVKFLKGYQPAMDLLNRERGARGERPLK